MRSRSTLHRAFVFGMLLVLGSCLPRSGPFATPSAADLADLESSLGADSTDVETAVALAAGYFAEDRVQDARALLRRIHGTLPSDPTPLVMLGLVEQELGIYESAADRYRAYLETQEGRPLADLVGGRLGAMRNDLLRTEIQDLLDATDPAARRELETGRIVVVPFARTPDDLDLDALGAGLTWMISRDLSARSFDVVDRDAVRIAIDEMGVQPLQRSELAVGIQVGHLFTARHVVLASLGRSDAGILEWDVSLLSVGDDGGFMDYAPVSAETDLENLLRVQVRLVEFLVRSANEEPYLPGFIESSRDRSPADVEALTAFGRGLQAMDSGDYHSAQEHFETALDRDPDFEESDVFARTAGFVADMNDVPTMDALEEAARIGELQRAVVALRAGPGSRTQQAFGRIGSRDRAVVAEALGLDRVGGGLLLDAVLVPTP